MPALDLSPASTPVLVIHAARSSNEDVVDKLVATGVFSTVDVFDAEYATPELGELTPYAAVLVYTDHSFDDAETLGNVLADYVDGGGGVVQAVFSSGLVTLAGRFDAEAYEALAGSDQDQGDPMTLVATDAGHPLLQDVDEFDGGSASYHTSDAVLTAGATAVAEWTNGLPLVAYKGSVVDLNFFPPSADARADLWVVGTDGDLLLRNALLFAAGRFASGTFGDDGDGDGVPDADDLCPGADDGADADDDGAPDACDPCPFDELDACAPQDTGCDDHDEDEDEDEDEDQDEDDDHDHRGRDLILRFCCDTGAAPAEAAAWVSLAALVALRRRR